MPAPLTNPWTFVITIGDPVRLASLQAQYPNGVVSAPATVAAFLGIPLNPTSPVASFVQASGYASSPTWTSNPPFGPYSPQTVIQGQDLTTDVASATVVPAFRDYSGNLYPANILYWVGYFLAAPGATLSPPPPIVPPIGVRRFAIGFETPLAGEFALASMKPSRDASRVLDGYGYAYRASAQNDGSILSMPANIRASWERFYIRVRQRPTGTQDMIWCVTGSDSANPMLHIEVTPTGALALYNRGAQGYPGVLLGTSVALTLNTWYRVDVRFTPAPVASGDGLGAWYINGGLVGIFVGTRGQPGLGMPQTHVNSGIGNNGGDVTTHGLEADVDDWIDSDFSTLNGVTPDITIGSHCQLVRAIGYAPAHDPAWVGDWRALLAQIAESSLALNVVHTQIASAQMEVLTDLALNAPIPKVASISVSIFDKAVTGGGTGQLGYRGAAPVLQNAGLGANSWSRVLFTAPGTAYIPVGTCNLIFIKDPSGLAANAYGATSLMASVELAGVFGPEDVPPTSSVTALSPTRRGMHNSPYPQSAWATSPFGSLADVAINYGTYVGNGTGQDVITVAIPHWFWVRPVGGAVDGIWWWSTMDTTHGFSDALMTPDRMFQALLDPATGNGFMRVAGADIQANAIGVTYQWVAVSDPGQRFFLNGAFRHQSGLASVLNTLIDPTFTPDGAFFFNESPATPGGSMSWFKGVGHTLDSASPIDGAVNATVAALAVGSITSKAAIHNAQGSQTQTAFAAVRRVDAGGLSGTLDLVTYIGNGAGGTRNIAVRLNGATPGFVIVTPHTAASYYRDPSHIGTQCSQINVGLVATNGIVGLAANQVQIGTALNTNGVVYDVFVLPKGPLGPFAPVPPGLGFGPVAPTTPTVFPTPPPSPSPLPSRGACYPLSQALIDLGSRLGDLNHVHWTAAELTRYIAEALRTYNAFTQSYRNRATFNATVFQSFYDLPTVIPALRAYTLADRDLVTDIEYALMEPPTPTAWTGTEQFDLATVAACLQKRRDQFLKETGAVLTREIVSLTVPVSGRIPLPIDVLGLRRVAWATPASVVTPLKRDDEWALTSYARSWPSNPADPASVWPTAYSAGVTPPLTLQLAPVPLSPGFLDLLAIVLGNALTPAVSSSLVGIPDDWAWVAKWGALADLLSQDGLAKDPQRAAYCEARWEQGLALATQASVVLAGQVSGAPQSLYSISDGDSYLRSWQNESGTPTRLLTAGHNVLALSKPPDTNSGGPAFVVTLDVVANMPVPVALGDCVNTGVDLAALDILYDYVEHLALFKEGPAQLTAAMDLYTRFARACGVTVALDMASTPDRQAIFGQTTQDTKVHSRTVPDPVTPSGTGATP